MAVADSKAFSGPFTANGLTVAFPFDFYAMSQDDVGVEVDGVKISSSLYSVALSDVVPSIGTVTFASAPKSGTLYVYSDPAFVSGADFARTGAYLPEAVDGEYDSAAIRDQALKRDLSHSLRTTLGDTLDPLPNSASRAGKFLAFDAGGRPVPATPTPGSDVGLRADMAAPNGLALLGFSQSSTFPLGSAGAKLKQLKDPRDAPYGAAGDGFGNDVQALEAWLAAQRTPYQFAPLPAGDFVTTYAQAFQFAGRWDRSASSARAMAKIGSRSLPFGNIQQTMTIYVGTGEVFTTVGAAMNYLLDRRIEGAIIVTVQVADGVYTEGQIYWNHPDGAKVRVIGNVATPANCTLNFTNTANLSGFYIAPGCALGFINGFKIVGNGGRTGYGQWNPSSFGGGIVASGGTVSVGGAMEVWNFFYSFLSDSRGQMTIAPGAKGIGAGDVAFHARFASHMLAAGCLAQDAADTTNGQFGSGFMAEAGSFLECSNSEAKGCAVAGFSVSGNSSVWAKGVYSHNNIWGAVAFEGTIDIGYEPVSGAATRLQANNNGVMNYGGRVTSSNPSTKIAQITGNTFDGITLDGDGAVFIGAGCNVSNNSGVGVSAKNGGRARLTGSTISANTTANTFTDTGNNSSVRTS